MVRFGNCYAFTSLVCSNWGRGFEYRCGNWIRLIYLILSAVIDRGVMQPLTHMSTREWNKKNVSGDRGRCARLTSLQSVSQNKFRGLQSESELYRLSDRNLWHNCLQNVGPLTFHKPIGLHGLSQDSFIFYFVSDAISQFVCLSFMNRLRQGIQ
jgi:hypothetical protein